MSGWLLRRLNNTGLCFKIEGIFKDKPSLHLYILPTEENVEILYKLG